MAKPISINISDATIKAINEEIGGRSAAELKADGDAQNTYMRKIALDFIETVKRNQNKIQELELFTQQLAEKRKAMRPAGEKTLSGAALSEYLTFKEQLEQKLMVDTNLDEFFQACMIFNERILTLITGKEMRTTIVIPQSGSNPPIIVDYSLEEMFSENSGISFVTDFQSRSYRITGRLHYDIQQVKAHMQNALHQDNYKSPEGLAELNLAYGTAVGTYKKYQPYVFWRPTSEKYWYKMKVAGGQGDLAEAYAAMHYLNLQAFAGRRLYDNLDTYYREGVANVDNVSGLYSSDILGDDLQYSYAVKSLGASLPGYVQMIGLATRILNNKVASVDQLKQIAAKRQWKDAAHTIPKGLRNKIEQVCNTSIPDVIKGNLT